MQLCKAGPVCLYIVAILLTPVHSQNQADVDKINDLFSSLNAYTHYSTPVHSQNQADVDKINDLFSSLDTNTHYSTPVHSQNQADVNKINHLFSSLDTYTLLENIQPEDLSDGVDCYNELKSLYDGLINGSNPHSIYFFDALGKPGSGVASGNMFMLGDYDLCKSLENAPNSSFIPCTSTAMPTIMGTPSPLPLTWTTCLPKACHGFDDVPSGFDDVIQIVLSQYPQIAKYIQLDKFKTTCEVNLEYDAGAYIAVTVCGVFILLVVLGTLWKPVLALIQSMSSSDDATLLVDDNKETGGGEKKRQMEKGGVYDSLLGRILECFSLQKCVPALLSTETKEGQIHCLNGIRFLSINWVVIGHVYAFGGGFGDQSTALSLLQRKSFLLIANGFASVDSFFLLSGFLVSYLLLKDLTRHNGRFRFLGYYFHRYIRLTIPMGVAMLVHGALGPIYIKGSLSSTVRIEHETCKDYWWTNILYINNLYPWYDPKICMGQVWYLSNDMQFYCFAPLFVYALWKSAKIGNAVVQTAIWGSALAAAYTTYHDGFQPIFDTHPHMFQLLYMAPWIRCTPYLVGILGGWLYWSFGGAIIAWTKRKKAWFKREIGVVIWVVSIAIQYAVVFGVHDLVLHPEHNTKAKSVSYDSLARIGWSVALVMQIFACQTGLGGWINSCLSWKGLLPLSRLTYGVYLLHILVMISYFTQLRHPFTYKSDFEVSVVYLGLLAVSYAASAILYLFVEQPITFLERISYRKS